MTLQNHATSRVEVELLPSNVKSQMPPCLRAPGKGFGVDIKQA